VYYFDRFVVLLKLYISASFEIPFGLPPRFSLIRVEAKPALVSSRGKVTNIMKK
jgi:hypothetical protein